MRSDQSPALPPQTQLAYDNRWLEWKAWVILSLNNDRNPERIDGIRQRHLERLTRLNQGLGINMKIIRRYQMDDPRITEPEMRTRLLKYRAQRDEHNPQKNVKGKYAR